MTGVDVDRIEAIDVHTHVQLSVADQPEETEGEGFAAMTKYFKAGKVTRFTVPMLAEYYRERRMAAVVFTVDSVHLTGREPHPPNEEIAELAAEYSDVLIPFASVDPHRGAKGVRTAQRLITEHGVRGFKFHPTSQGFFPNDRMAYPLYEVLAEHGMVALFHTGQTGAGAGRPGGGGLRLKYSNPMAVDDVAADFPDLKIILAHPSFPWQDEALSVAMHKPGVHIDLSGWSPKYFPPQLVQYANTLLADKVLFGSDFPMITPDRWLADFANAGFRDEVRPKILKANAARLFGLTGAGG
ncbi:amidohydrolase family protein [Actinophytocola glycyrrhizae]|uniref:Amidohydrolase family protein n=1 Tax=Actinophytocola glycyrrhizae TaxID=2044873 RepID=A0ABV9S4J0_9PSEU